MTKIKMTPELRKHYATLGKLGRKAVNSKYSKEVQREWASKGGKIGMAKRWSNAVDKSGVDL